MKPPAGKFKFGDWLPDLSDLDNPGILEALNVLPVGKTESGYAPYSPLATSGTALVTGTSIFDCVALLAAAIGGSTPYVYVGTLDGHLYQSLATGGSWTDYSGGVISQPISSLAQYNNLLFAAANTAGIWQKTVGSGSNATQVVGAPNAGVLGVIGQFLVAGNISTTPLVSPHLVMWSAIGNPTNWPTVGSAAAIAAQSGEQFLHYELGAVTGIFGGDQWGVILQQNGITRVTYIGGAVVFQFDTLSGGIGMDYANAAVKIGGLIYFASSRGFYATDGVSVLPIGEEKVNRWFVANVVDVGDLPFGSVAVDWTNKLIYWGFGVAGTAPLVVYNFETKRFTHAGDANFAVMVAANVASFTSLGVQAIGQDKKLGFFTGTPGTATLTTSEVELNPGGKTLVQGFRPQVTRAGITAPSITVRIGQRSSEGGAVFFGSAITPNASTGFADALVEDNYHRAETDIAGAFTQAIGGEFLSEPAGDF